MALNIQATRKLSLEEFAIGWKECFLTVKVATPEQVERYNEEVEALRESDDTDALSRVMRDFATRAVASGKIMNTDESGEASLYSFTYEEISDVVDALGIAWHAEIISISTGADRLKS